MSKDLVAYFSATGVTAGFARRIADTVGADLFEIRPQVPYTKADLNWMNPFSRSTKEMKKKGARPAIAADDAKIGSYDRIFLGFPIWWYIAPTIINTFLEGYDWAGKQIVLFATSGGSGFGKALESLQDSCPGATLREGVVQNKKLTEQALENWLKTL